MADKHAINWVTFSARLNFRAMGNQLTRELQNNNKTCGKKQKSRESVNRYKMGKKGGAGPPSKRRKSEVVFNEDKRRDFLTGFRKRKEERRKKAREQFEKSLKEEIKAAKCAFFHSRGKLISFLPTSFAEKRRGKTWRTQILRHIELCRKLSTC